MSNIKAVDRLLSRYGEPSKHTRKRQHNPHIILTKRNPPKPTSPRMQLLTLFLLAVSAGALPQSQTLSPTATLAPTVDPLNSTKPNMHGRDFEMPTLGNFDDPKCHGTHLGTKATIDVNEDCIKFSPANAYLDIFWGDSNGSLDFYSDDQCSKDHHLKAVGEVHHSHTCVEVASLGGKVLSVNNLA